MYRIITLAFIGVAVGVCSTAQAHNLFVLIEPQQDGPDLVDVIFEHFPYPGDGTYNQPHLDRGKTWVHRLGAEKNELVELAEQTRLGKKFLQGKTDSSGPRAIIHSCKWGVYKGRLDYFHGKYLDVTSKANAAKFAHTPELPLDLVPSFEGETLKIAVHFEEKPLAQTRVSIWPPGGKETKQTTDESGVIIISTPKNGTWSFSAVHTLKGPEGEFNGEPYKGVMHGTTVSLKLPLK